jgi:dTMP kinase
MKGNFLVVEGPDGSGTTTQVDRLASFLRTEGHDVYVTNEPTDGEYGKVVQKMVGGTYFDNDIAEEEKARRIAEEFVKDRKQHQKEIRNKLQDNDFVISDRYYHSTYAYQETHGVGFETIRNLHKDIIGDELHRPDLTLVLDIDTDVSMERIDERGQDKAIFENASFQEKVMARYRNLDERLEGEIEMVDSDRSIQQVARSIRKILKQKEFIEFDSD